MANPQRHRCLLSLGFLTLALSALLFFSPLANRGMPADHPVPQQLLEQVLTDILTNPILEDTREFYGTLADRRVALVKESPAGWPTKWQPRIANYEIQFLSEKTPVEDFVYWHLPAGPWIVGAARSAWPRLLAIRLDKLNLQPVRDYDNQISVCLFNVGGDGGEAGVIGGCIVYYTINRKEGNWLAEYAGSFDP